MLQRIELYGLGSAISRAWRDYTFTIHTRRAVATAVIALATVIEIGCGIVGGTIAGDFSEAPAVYTILSISTSIATHAAVVDICLDIGADVITVLRSFSANTSFINAIITVCDMCTAMIRGVCFACYVGAIVVKMGIANT